MNDDIIRIPTAGMNSLFCSSDTEEIQSIALDRIDDFPGHPYPVTEDEALRELMNSLQKNGQLEPAILRDMRNGRYQLLSGHRRKLAMQKLGCQEMRAVVLTRLTDNQAWAVMLDCNEKRDELLPTEKGRIFYEKARLYQSMSSEEQEELREMFSPQERFSVTSSLAKRSEESETQIKRYIRLYRKADNSIQQMVDSGQMSLRIADELTSLSKALQRNIAEILQENKRALSCEQAAELHRCGESLTPDAIPAVLGLLKSEPKEHSIHGKLHLSVRKLKPYFPSDFSAEQMEEVILQLLEEWSSRNQG